MHLSAWMGAGVLAAGVSAALVAGADVASADTGSDTSTASESSSSDDATDTAGEASEQPDTTEDDDTGSDDAESDEVESEETESEETEEVDEVEEPSDEVDIDDAAAEEPEAIDTVSEADPEPAEELAETPVDDTPDVDTTEVTATTTRASSATRVAAAAPALPVLPEKIQSFLFDVIGVAVTFIAGPPVVPRGSTVTVRTSSLEITDGRKVPAHWYYPEGDEPPQRIIYLQHGFLGVGAMYSHTAANLAESTNSIVVVPTLTSNRYARDGFWLGSDQALRATAALFDGDRDALTASAVAAGYAARYGAGVALPGRFALVGHSLGGNLVAGAAGYYADAVTAGGVTNELAGVILLDAAPQGTVLSDALDKLDGLDTYIPVIELGAPKDARRVDEALNTHRPGRFNGVVLERGEHLDAMQGGTKLIQFISHLYQGFPTAQNQAAAQILIDGWAGDILDGRIDPTTGRCDGDACAGIYGAAGQTLELDTRVGPARGTVIGVPAPVRSAVFTPWSVTATIAPRPPRELGPLLRL